MLVAVPTRRTDSIYQVTPGKEYKIIRIGRKINDELGRSFWVNDDQGQQVYCLEYQCGVGGAWRIFTARRSQPPSSRGD